MNNYYYLWKQIDEIDPSLKRYAEHPSAFILFSIILIVQLMKEIKLTKGFIAQVDNKDFKYLCQWNWIVRKSNHTYYAARTIQVDKKQKMIYMHRVIMNTPINLECDHEDHNGLNNQRYNLRNCTHNQNQMNKRYLGKSKYIGVSVGEAKYKNKTYKYIAAHICPSGIKIHLGRFKTEIEAAKVRDIASKKYFGEFANLNFK